MTRQIQSQCGNDSCASCKSNKCNANIFPEDRLSCLHCEGSDCVNQRNTVEVRYPCANYQPNDSCYSVFSNGKCDLLYNILTNNKQKIKQKIIYIQMEV